MDHAPLTEAGLRSPVRPFGVEGRRADRDGFVRQREAFLTAFPDVTMSILDIVDQEERTATRWQAEGTHNGELMGIAPTGRRVRIAGIIVTRFEDGKALEEWEQIDLLGLMQQIGGLAGLP